MPYFEAVAGACIGSIAQEHGFFWQTLWDLPENAALKAKRGDPNVLAAGDQVFVPELRAKMESGATDTRHKFRRKGVPSWFKLQLRDAEGKGRAGLAFSLDVDGTVTDGTTDDSGKIAVPIPPGALRATLTVGTTEVYVFDLGHIDPVDSTAGMKARLKNLGFYRGEVNDSLDDATTAAIALFQQSAGLEQSGEADDATRTALATAHGC